MLVECRLTLDIVGEQEYHRHSWEENVQICKTASSESRTLGRFEELARKITNFSYTCILLLTRLIGNRTSYHTALCTWPIWNYSPNYSLNCTPLSPITITCRYRYRYFYCCYRYRYRYRYYYYYYHYFVEIACKYLKQDASVVINRTLPDYYYSAPRSSGRQKSGRGRLIEVAA